MTFPFPFFVPGSNPNLYEIIQSTGTSSGLQMALDAGASSSYTSGQKWLDLTSGGYDVYLGADGTASASDPTFHGSPGGLSSSEYFSYDGGDYFTYDTTNETWMNSLHKDNAVFTILFAFYISSLASTFYALGTRDNSDGPIGIYFNITTSGHNQLVCSNGSANSLNVTADAAASTGTWCIHAVSVDEAAASGFFYNNGNYDTVSSSNTFNATYSSPSASNANGFNIGSPAGGSNPAPSGNRIACLGIWTRALSKTELDSIYNILKTRWGL